MDAIAVTMGELSRVLKNIQPPPLGKTTAYTESIDLDAVLFPDGRPIEEEAGNGTP